MSKNDPHVRELLRKNQFAEALRYYRTRYQADRADAMRILQEIQGELSGKPPAGLVTASGAPLASSQPTPQPAPKLAPVVHVSPEPARPAPEPPKPAVSLESPRSVVSFQSKEIPTLKGDHQWESLTPALRQELQHLLEDGRVLDAIRSYWYERSSELRVAKENVLRWAAVFPPKL